MDQPDRAGTRWTAGARRVLQLQEGLLDGFGERGVDVDDVVGELVDGLADYEALVTARKKAIRSRDQEVPSQEGTGGIKNLVVLLAVILVAVLFIVASARYNGVTKRRAREDSQQDLQNLWIESQRARERELRGGRDFDPSSP